LVISRNKNSTNFHQDHETISFYSKLITHMIIDLLICQYANINDTVDENDHYFFSKQLLIINGDFVQCQMILVSLLLMPE
jgi:hypothetical protein